MLEIRNLNKTFFAGTVNEKPVLRDLSLRLEDGDFVTVIGSNGAGKSTLLNTVAGTLLPDSGSILLDGNDITFRPKTARAKVIGRVFQDPMIGTAPNMAIEENLAMAYRRTKRRTMRCGIRNSERAKYRVLLQSLNLGLESRLNTKVGQLSGGQRQALTLLMATLCPPRLLLLDEHTAALDPKTAATVLQLSNRLIQEHSLTTLMVTHNMQNALEYGNRLIMMHAGRIILDVRGEEKRALTVEALMQKFETLSGSEFSNDRALLS